MVNKSLEKEEFDCSNIGDFYDCGCAEDEADKKTGGDTSAKTSEAGTEREKKKAEGDDGRIDVEVHRNG